MHGNRQAGRQVVSECTFPSQSRVLPLCSQSCYAALATSLEALLLIGLSSHISKLLLIYTELMRVGNLNYTVIGVTTGNHTLLKPPSF